MLDWIMANKAGLLAALLGIHGLAIAIVALTPTPKDNMVLGKVYKYIIEPLAGLLGKAKE